MNICLNCTCFKESKVIKLSEFVKEISDCQSKAQQCSMHTKKGEQYCTKCARWLCQECFKYHQQFTSDHIIIEHELEMQCLQHKKPFAFYCQRYEAIKKEIKLIYTIVMLQLMKI